MGHTSAIHASSRRSARTVSTPTGVGVRVRALRIDAGLTQAELGGSRFTKEYVSQVELGKTKPSDAALAWFAERWASIAVDARRGERSLRPRGLRSWARAGGGGDRGASRRPRRWRSSPQLDDRRRAQRRRPAASCATRRRAGWALHHLGLMPEALRALAAARGIAEQLTAGRPRRRRSTGSGSCATRWAAWPRRSRCWTRRCGSPSSGRRPVGRAARTDLQRARQDPPPPEGFHRRLRGRPAGARARARARTTTGCWPRRYSTPRWSPSARTSIPLAREYAERSKALYERVSDHEYVGKLLNNLGQLHAITGKPEEAVPLLRESFRIAVEQDNRVDAGFAASSLASARMHSGDLEGAIESGNRAIELLSDREEYREEEGNARIVIGRALLALDRIDEAERSFEAAAAVSRRWKRSVIWPAHGWRSAMSPSKAGRPARAAELYRRAAEALQDVRW